MKTKTLSALRKITDRLFSLLVRKKQFIDFGEQFCVCVICEMPMRWQDAECGHYIDRANLKTRYSEINCMPICPPCNRKQRDSKEIQDKFRSRLIYLHGEEAVKELDKDYKIHKITRFDYEEMISEFTKRLKELK